MAGSEIFELCSAEKKGRLPAAKSCHLLLTTFSASTKKFPWKKNILKKLIRFEEIQKSPAQLAIAHRRFERANIISIRTDCMTTLTAKI